MAEQAPVVYGKYQLLDLLARGGMAEVFKAKSHGVEGFEKVLVIKRILPELSENPQFVEMFINEAKIAVTLSHANIVQVFDLGRTEGSYFIAMEYVAGYDLATVLRRGRRYKKPLPQELAVYIASEVAKALDYAHRRRDSHMRALNIVHRDVSPQNVLLSYEGEVKLTDFGIAKARTTVEGDTEIGVLKGKYAYMAPEQANSREVDARTDLFALGTVLYEALSGQNPFIAPSTYDTLQKVRTGEHRALAEVAREVPAELSEIVGRAMNATPDGRHPNAGRLYEDLIQFLYSSGRRVGAHDLSRYLDELREAGEAGRGQDDSRLKAAFDPEGSGAVPGPGATPVEVPSRASHAPATTGSGGRPRTPTSTGGVSRPRAERRDVSAIAILSPPNDPTPESIVHSLVRRFGGQIVDRERAPDGARIVVLFGAADPDGRDTESALRCALRIARAASNANESMGEVGPRIGVHAGRVLVDIAGEVVRDRRYENLMVAVNGLAERVAAGHVMATDAVEKICRNLFHFTGEANGKKPTYRVSGEKSVAEAYGKFVGRRNELRRVGELLAVANKGRRKVLALVGEAGTGKTRLLLETMRRLRLGGHDVGMYLATVGRQNRDVPLSTFQEMLRVVLGIDELDPEPLIRDKVLRLRELGLTAPEMRAVEIALGLPVEEDDHTGAPAGGRPLRAALARIATRLAEDRLTVFAFDGIDGMDDESQALLDGLLRDARDARIAVVLAYRPGYVHPWSEVAGYEEIEVGPLDDEDVVRLTGVRLGADEVPMDLLRDVTAKSGGNPLYVEEYLKALVDAGAVEVGERNVIYRPDVAEVEVPKTLRGIVAARVARLGPTQRHLLQVASVVGQRFGSDVLAKVAGEDASTVARALSVLERRGIVVRQGASEYAFAHDLVGEVLRSGLTLDARKEIHGAVASAIEELHPQRVEEMAERLAEHWRQAGDRPKAIDYLVRAADRLEAEQALDGAIANLMRAIEMLSQLQNQDRDRMLALYRRIGELSFRRRDLEAGAARMAHALEIAEELGRDELVARFAMMRGRLLGNANRFEEGRQWLESARGVARRLGNRELLRDVTLATAEVTTKNGEYSTAVGLLKEALVLSRDTGDLAAQIRCLIPLSLAYSATGEHDLAMKTIEDARRLAGMHPDRYTDCELLKTEALIAYNARDWALCVDSASRAIELAKEYGFTYEATVNAHNVGDAYLRMGDYKRAFASLKWSYDMAKENGFTKLEYNNLRVLGFIDAVRFKSEEGRRRIVEAIDYAKRNGYLWDLVQSLYMLALSDHVLGNVDEARKGLREVLRLTAESGDARYHEDAQQALRALDAGDPIPLPQ